MTTKTQEEMAKRFDEKFPWRIYGVAGEPKSEFIEGKNKPDEIKSFIQEEIDRAVAERDREVVDIIRKENYELEEWYSSAERPRDISVFDANQRNIATRNKILSLITKEK